MAKKSESVSILKAKKMDAALKSSFERIANMGRFVKKIRGVPTCYEMIDSITGGLHEGQLIVVAGRPSSGKTSFITNIALNAARKGARVGFFSLEMSHHQLANRFISMESHVACSNICTGSMSSDDWVEMVHAAARLDEHSIFIDDEPERSVDLLCAKARELKKKKKIDLLIIDYLQLLQIFSLRENRTNELTEICHTLKMLANELDIPILITSQLSRALESRDSKIPMLSDLRDSGAIEQVADVVLMIYRDSMYNANTDDPASAEIIIAKHRNGPTAVVNLSFIKEYMMFIEK